MANEIVNKVAESGIITLDLADFYPKQEVKIFDLKNYLFMGLILKEKDYRAALQTTDWTVYENKNVCVVCSADAIIPMWAYMLAASYLQPFAANVVFGNENKLVEDLMSSEIATINIEDYIDKRVVIKGCGEQEIPASAYVAITSKLKPVVKSLMYGEPCSTVPIYKKSIAK